MAPSPVARAVRWTALGGALRLVLQFAQLMVLARLLGADAFGEFAVVMAASTLMLSIGDFGVNAATIYFDEPTPIQRASLFWFAQLFSSFWALILFGAATLVEVVAARPDLTQLVAWGLAAGYAGLLAQQPKALSEKRLNFGRLILCEVSAHACGVCCAIILAALGLRVGALITGLLVSQILMAGLFWFFLECELPSRPALSLVQLRDYLRFGAPLTVSRLVNTVASQLDIYVAALFFTPRQLGEFSVPRNLGLQVLGLINPIITRLGFPVISAVGDDRKLTADAYSRVLFATAAFNAPCYAALFFLADAIVSVLLGPGWETSAAILQVFAVWGFLRAIGNPVGALLLGTGRPALAMGWDMAVLVVMGIAVASSVTSGPLALGRGLVVAMLTLYFPLWWFLVRPQTGVSFTTYLRCTLVPALFAAAAGYSTHIYRLASPQPLAELIAGAAQILLLYVLASMLFYGRDVWRTFMSQISGPSRG